MKRIVPFKKITNARTVKGAGRGKKLGIATVNFDPNAAAGLKAGIYVCKVIFDKPYWGVLHFGPRPVFGEKDQSLEVHLFDFKEGQEAKTADIEVHMFIRAIKNFENAAQMLEVIKKDILIAKRHIKKLKRTELSH